MSMVKISLDTDRDIGQSAQELQRDFYPKLYRGITREIIPLLERDLDRAVKGSKLTQEPPERNANSPKFGYSTDPVKNARGRRWVFANYPNGYKRRHKTAKAWESEIPFKDGVAEVRIFNDTPGASYPYGAPEYGFVQSPGPVVTGWANAGEEAQPIILETTLQLNEAIGEYVGRLIVKALS